jgi:virginiamycin B lyase
MPVTRVMTDRGSAIASAKENRRRRTFRHLRFAVVVLVAGSMASCTTGQAPTQRPTTALEQSPSAASLPIATPSPTTAPSPTPQKSLVAAQSMEDAGATRLAVTADWMAVGGGFAWAAADSGVERLDGRDGSLLSSIPVPTGLCLGFDVAFGSVWAGVSAGGSPSLVRIDQATGKVVATIPLKVAGIQCESSVGAGEGAVWVISRAPGRVLVKIDPATNAVTATFPMPPEDPLGQHPADTDFGGVRAGYGGVWIADQGKDALLRMSPVDGSIVALIPLGSGSGPRFVAIGEGSVWVLNQTDGTVSRIDPQTNSVVATIAVSSIPVDGGDIAVGCGAVWARVDDELVARIDPAADEVVGRYGPPADDGSVACADDVLWISAHDVNAIWRLPLP